LGSILGKYALEHLDEAEWIVKVEGLTDMLALHTKLQEAGLLGKYLVISNSQGTLEGVKTEWIVALTGKKVIIVHDADRPGQIGANRWVHALAGKASEVRNAQLPYE